MNQTRVDEIPDEITDELYGVPPPEFVATRDARATDIERAGDRVLARAVRRLRRPTLAAWAVNLLVRQERGLLDRLLSVGEELRVAQEQLRGEALRQLNRQRHQVLAALTRRARDLAAEGGHRLGDTAERQVEQTLSAALADPDAAREVCSGRLTAALPAYSGFGPLPSAAPAPQPRAPARTQRPKGVDAATRRKRERLRAELEKAHDEHDRANADLERAERQEQEVRSAREAAQRDYEAAQSELRRRQDALRSAEDALAAHEQTLRGARRAREAALRRVRKLEEQLRATET
ncbi:hypothetical protein LX15_002469 [Streptoalloteichus tenebrarius]|uniref:Transposase n=1 Tax=Streptoalloteichus tenebrarius (strain ATCC 17920 / DSM 40477 / JCM 4838 / CBS 697.72 / NBRC 16177 / NCIMB 11028 / NRRL B-12390 / A12253. 1 / ISP 5477) TaxID=1933 RepID=A0ABT1HTE7_STRSD|nr:hypothetical protein [Streptoalloteichus tenebrarius]MCP2258771.1 hypothetical protein [Streptoalloteichus tenebrarius]